MRLHREKSSCLQPNIGIQHNAVKTKQVINKSLKIAILVVKNLGNTSQKLKLPIVVGKPKLL